MKLLLDERRGQLDQMKRRRAAELRGIFTSLGPTFVKIGQGLSTRPDICPPEYLEELSELQVQSPRETLYSSPNPATILFIFVLVNHFHSFLMLLAFLDVHISFLLPEIAHEKIVDCPQLQ